MSNNLKLSLTLDYHGAAFTSGIERATRQLNKFSTSAQSGFGRVTAQVRKLNAELNGFSTITKMAAGYIGMQGLRSIMDANLAFERTMLQLKWNAQMTKSEIADIRKMSLDMARDTLNTPQQMAAMNFRLGNAGLKIAEIKAIGSQIAPAAQVFGSDPDAMADMAYDMVTKSHIKENRLGAMLNMMYYHATSGRFETSSMAREAPKLLNAGATVGITGENGLNFMGALTQRLMRRAIVSEPSMVSTMAEEGFAHLTMPHYQKGLLKFGIDIKKYFDDKGHFKGEGGVEGLIDLTRAMKRAHLDNPFNLGEAGFREKETRQFWLEMMASLDADDSDKDPNLIKMMERGNKAKNSNALEENLKDLKNSAPGKDKAADIEVEKYKLSDSGASGTDWYESVKLWAMDHKKEAVLGIGGAIIGGRLMWNKYRNGNGGAGGGAFGGAVGGAQPVFVTNWPTGMLGPGEAMKQKRNERGTTTVGGAASSESGGIRSKSRAAFGGLKSSLKFGAPLAMAMGAWDAYQVSDSDISEKDKKNAYGKIAGGTTGSLIGAGIGGGIGALFGGFGAIPGSMIGGAIGDLIGEKIAEWMQKDPIKVVVDVQNGNITASVNEKNIRAARRN